eukprot:1078250-Pelagomonas_calceolata.AAC.1
MVKATSHWIAHTLAKVKATSHSKCSTEHGFHVQLSRHAGPTGTWAAIQRARYARSKRGRRLNLNNQAIVAFHMLNPPAHGQPSRVLGVQGQIPPRSSSVAKAGLGAVAAAAAVVAAVEGCWARSCSPLDPHPPPHLLLALRPPVAAAAAAVGRPHSLAHSLCACVQSTSLHHLPSHLCLLRPPLAAAAAAAAVLCSHPCLQEWFLPLLAKAPSHDVVAACHPRARRQQRKDGGGLLPVSMCAGGCSNAQSRSACSTL